MTARTLPSARRTSGFTLVEMLVSLAVMIIVILGVLALFDFNSKLARAQTQLAEMQQSQRVAHSSLSRYLRMAGRGRLPQGTLPAGAAIEVRNNVGLATSNWPSTDLLVGVAGTPKVVPGTDVLIVRGAFAAPIYQIDNSNAATFAAQVDGGEIVGGTLAVQNVSHTGVHQGTEALIAAIGDGSAANPGNPEVMFLASPLDDRILALVVLDPDQTLQGGQVTPENLQLVFDYDNGSGQTDALKAVMQTLYGSAAFPGALTSVAFAGIIEEYRFYVREAPGVDGPIPRLAMARMNPFTEVPYRGDMANAQIDLADNIADFQTSLGVDLDGDGQVVAPAAYADGRDDEWLFNHSTDEAAFNPVTWNPRRLFYVKLSTLARTERRDWNYRARALRQIEDREYNESPVPADDAARADRMYRRRQLETVIDLRNVT